MRNILKNNWSGTGNKKPIRQIKTQVESLTNKLEHVEKNINNGRQGRKIGSLG